MVWVETGRSRSSKGPISERYVVPELYVRCRLISMTEGNVDSSPVLDPYLLQTRSFNDSLLMEEGASPVLKPRNALFIHDTLSPPSATEQPRSAYLPNVDSGRDFFADMSPLLSSTPHVSLSSPPVTCLRQSFRNPEPYTPRSPFPSPPPDYDSLSASSSPPTDSSWPTSRRS